MTQNLSKGQNWPTISYYFYKKSGSEKKTWLFLGLDTLRLDRCKKVQFWWSTRQEEHLEDSTKWAVW